ncbi:MAG: signal recognition particle protein [bacterium]
MFESLTDKLQGIFERLRGKGRVSEQDVNEAMREVRIALLEADVNFRVVKDFVNLIREKAVGQDVLESLTAAQQVIKIVRDQLIELLGGQVSDVNWAGTPPTVFLLCGLQGCGKTTTAAKLARYWKKQGKKPMMVAADVQRPAAIKQLEVLGEQVGVPVFSRHDGASPSEIIKGALQNASERDVAVLIVDTAGRLQIDEALMQELRDVKQIAQPHESFLVVDATTGQEAVNVSQTFNEQLGIDSVIVTKMDGDARGGAILSVKAVTGKPIRFYGTGEKDDAIEVFHPDRIAGRILGMGDVLSLVERAEQAIDIEKAQEMERRLRKKQLDFNDFLEQMQQVRRMGPLDQVMGMIPGLNKIKQSIDGQAQEESLKRVEAIIHSMTPRERSHPEIFDGSRKRRVAAGSGTTVQEINELIKQLTGMRQMLKTLMGGAGSGKKKKWPGALPRF